MFSLKTFAHCCNESLSLRKLLGKTKTLYVCACCRYKLQKRISDPILDRIGIHLEVPRVDYEKLSDDRVGEPSECMRERVQAARADKRNVSPAMDHQISSVMLTCVWGRYGNFASYPMMVKA